MDFKNKKVSLELNTKPMNDQPSQDILHDFKYCL